jgi:hypothetical protein
MLQLLPDISQYLAHFSLLLPNEKITRRPLALPFCTAVIPVGLIDWL